MNFIKKQLISKLEKEVKKRQFSYTHDGFFFFNEPIVFAGIKIDRINEWAVYEHDRILPKKFSIVTGVILLHALKKILNEEYYLYKYINGKNYKIKTKKDETFRNII